MVSYGRMADQVTRAASPDEVIYSLQVALEKETRNSSEIADLVRMVIKDQQWHEFHSFTGAKRKHGSFREFVTAPRYDGLGTTRDGLLAILRLEDEELAAGVEKAWREDVAPALKLGDNQHSTETGSGATRPSQRDGLTSDSILAKLKREDPMTAQAVINGDLTANAAARMKGWRKPRILLTSPDSVAKRIREHYSPEEITELIEHLGGETP